MKRIIVLLGTIFVLLMSGTTGAFADAGGYDFESANYYVYVATPDGGLNIRSGPGVEYERVMNGRIPDGVRLYIEYVSGNWGYTSYKDYIGWVALKQTTRTPPATPAPPATKAPIVTQAPQNTVAATVAPQEPAPTVEEVNIEEENKEEPRAAKMMMSQILLAAVLIVFIIAAAVVLIVYINSKSRK